MSSLLTPQTSAEITARIELGLSFADACTAAGVKVETARTWLARGRREDEGGYHDFADAVERARENVTAISSGLVTAGELALLVSRAARAGNVSAMRLRHRMLQEVAEARPHAAGADTAMAEVDELAARRGASQQPSA